MNNIIKNYWEKSWPHMVAVAIFMTLTCVYFAPAVFNSKQLPQGDMISAQGMGHDAKVYHDETGEWSYWSNGMFGGMPHNVTYGIPSNSIFRPLALSVRLGLPENSAGLLWLYLLGFYIFMLACGSDVWLAIVGAIAFALASYNIIIIDAGHVTKALVIATVPMMIGGVMMTYQKRYIAGFIVTLLATGLNIYWNHQQISYYAIIMLVVLAIAYLIAAIREKTLKDFAIASAISLAAAVLAIAPAVDKLLPTMDYSKETMRGGAVLEKENDDNAGKEGLDRDYAFMWSYGKGETMTLLIPNFYGASSNYPIGEESETYKTLKKYAGAQTARQFAKSAPTYWGDQPFTSGPVYAGAIICLLFVLGLMVVEQKNRWWMLAAAMIGILMSWGRNLPWLNNWLFDNLPLYSKFRTPSMSLVITTTVMAMLGMMALRDVVARKVKPLYVLIALGVSGGVCLLFALFPGLAGDFSGSVDQQLPDWLIGKLREDRRNMLSADAWRSLVFILLAGGIMWTYLKWDKMKSWMMVAFVGALVLIDLWAVDKHFLNDDHFVPAKQQLINPTPSDQQIAQDTDLDYRVLNLASNTFNESRTSYYHKSVGGYSPAKLRRYQDIIDYYLSRRLNWNIINMLNTRYVITKEGVQFNPRAMGNAWFVREIAWVNNPNEEIAAIGDADLQNIAIIDTCWRSQLSASIGNENGQVTLTEYDGPSHLVYEYENETNGLLVFSEVYYKTWKAYVDGVEVPLVRANYILRAAEVPAGKHNVELRCVDELFVKTHLWSLIASIIVCVVLVLLLGLMIWKR